MSQVFSPPRSGGQETLPLAGRSRLPTCSTGWGGAPLVIPGPLLPWKWDSPAAPADYRDGLPGPPESAAIGIWSKHGPTARILRVVKCGHRNAETRNDGRLSTAFHNYGDVSAAGASRLAALLVGHMRPACSLLAPCDPGAAAPEYVAVIVKRSTKWVEGYRKYGSAVITDTMMATNVTSRQTTATAR